MGIGLNSVWATLRVPRTAVPLGGPLLQSSHMDIRPGASFNIAYRVQCEIDRFGTWNLVRSKHNPLTGRIGYPRWFAVDLDEFRRQLQILNAMGIYQHEQPSLDDAWFQSLLRHLL